MTAIPLARIHGKDDLRLDSVESPVCGDDDVVVKVRQCGICGSDLGYVAMGGLTGPEVPMPLGHELWGEVNEIGRNVTHVVAGDRVVVSNVPAPIEGMPVAIVENGPEQARRAAEGRGYGQR